MSHTAASSAGAPATITGPAAKSTGPAATITGPAATITGPAATITGPAAKSTGPVAKSTGPVAKSTGPAVPAVIERLTGRIVSGGATTQIIQPSTGEPLTELPVSGAADVAAAYERARAAQRSWAELSPAARTRPFLRFHDAILDRRAEILDIVQLETGKARRHAYDAPMGGMKNSGGGRRHGSEGLLKYTEVQPIVSQGRLGLEPVMGMPYERYAAMIARGLKTMKRLRLR